MSTLEQTAPDMVVNEFSTPHNVTPVSTPKNSTPGETFRAPSTTKTTIDSSLCDSDSESIISSSSSTHVEEFKAIGSWGTYGVDPKAFCDKLRPVERNFKDLELNDEDLNGFLTDKIIANGSSYLEQCPLIRKYVLCKAVLKNKKLRHIGALKHHNYLQYLDLSCNELTEVSVLSNLPFLIHLDVSHNEIHELLDFNPPFNLTFVDYSYNSITKMRDISGFWAIKSLDLSHNQIEKIYGLQDLKYLETLDLSHNHITKIENLDKLNIITLNLHHNEIISFDCDSTHGFKTMPLLTYVSLGHNELTSLKIFEGAAFLQSIDLQSNNISSLLEISHLQQLNLLLSVNFNGNPVRNIENYDTVCFDIIKNLRYLDGALVEVEDKIKAKPPPNLKRKMRAGQHSGWLLGLSHLTALPCLGADVLPNDVSPRPLVIVVGPIGSKIDNLLQQFVSAHEHSTSRLILHTDRDMFDQETPCDFHFIYPKQFQKMLEEGEFIIIFNVLNDNYGLSHEEFSRNIQQTGKVMLMWADLNSALELRLRGLQPYIILAMPSSEQTHEQWISEAYETQVHNIKYPEAAIDILNRESAIFSSSSSYSTDLFERSNIENIERICENCPEDDYQDDIEKIYFKYTGMRQYCWKKLHKGSCDCEDYCPCEDSYMTEESVADLSYQGSSIIFPENLLQSFYQKVMKSREGYIDFHRENPGVIYDVIYTDEDDKAKEILKHVCKKALRVQRKHIHIEPIDNNTLCQSLVENRLQMINDDIEKAMIRDIRCKK